MSPQSVESPFLVAMLSFLALVSAQNNQGVRLADSPLGSHAGRVEIKYNGAWGTICDNEWDNSEAIVTCRMLNFPGGVCAVRSGSNVFGEGTGNVWLTRLRCSSRDTSLDNCRTTGPLTTNPCPHSQDAAVICQDYSVMPVPNNITELFKSPYNIIVGWKLGFIPPYVRFITFVMDVSSVESPSRLLNTHYYRTLVTEDSREFNYTLSSSLSYNTSYKFSIRAEGEYQWCYNKAVKGNSSEVIISTLENFPPSTLPMRLLSQDWDFVGRLQVMHDGEWGNVCGDSFGDEEVNVACWSLNYTRGAVCYANNPFPSTSAPTLLDDVDCRQAVRFEDCAHRGWGVHNCNRRETVGLVCNPGPSAVPIVTELRLTEATRYRITVAWQPVGNITTYSIRYQFEGSDRPEYERVRSPPSKWTLLWPRRGTKYTIDIRAEISFSDFVGGTCSYQYMLGDFSQPVYAIPSQESAPSAPVREFHVRVLNSTAAVVTWRPPSSGINGNIRGYKLYVDEVNGNRRIINIVGSGNTYLVTDLEELSTYLFSILMYTVGDGPLSVRLQVTMPSATTRLITKFGVYGDGLETLEASTTTRGFNVLCGSNVPDVSFYWMFVNGSRIGSSNPGFRACHFENGTAVLQIGTAMPSIRTLTLCDGGRYKCVATSSDGGTAHRYFSLRIGSSQPQLGSPRLVQRGSTWIQIVWEPLDCDGGYPLSSYLVDYRVAASIYSSYTTIRVVTGLNYTIRDLSPSTEYSIKVGRENSVDTMISYSGTISVMTLNAGPTPPLGVAASVGFNSEVCVRWRPPAAPVGNVTLYRLYVESEDSLGATVALDLPSTTAVSTFLGNETTGCMKLEVTGVLYHFQISAVAVINGFEVEGNLSPFSEKTTVFVPEPGILPQPVTIEGSTTNTSATLQWELPGYSQLKDNNAYINVSYSGVVEWTSPAGVYTSFLEQGWKTTEDTSLTFSLLTPSTSYIFSVGIVTDDGQHRPELSLTLTTGRETGGKLAYFQLRIQNIGSDCIEWVAEDTEDKLSQIQESLQQSLFQLCQCRPQLSQAEFSCRTGPPDTVIYRARITGTASRSTSEVAAILGAWVQANQGSIKIDHLRLHLDPTCDPTLENIHGPDCPVVEPPTETTTTMTDTTPNATTEVTNTTTEATRQLTTETPATLTTEEPTTKATHATQRPSSATEATMEATTSEGLATDEGTDGEMERTMGNSSVGESSSSWSSPAAVVVMEIGLLLLALLITLLIMYWFQRKKAKLSSKSVTKR